MKLAPSVFSLVRIIFLVALAFVIVFYPAPREILEIESPVLPPLVTFLSILLAILIVRSLDRLEKLISAIYVELNKTRRLYHLGKNLAEKTRRPWFTDLHGYVYDYHIFFDKHNFEEYEKANALYRKITYHIYAIPEVGGAKETVLYEEMLRAAADAVMARENINALRKGGFPIYVWFVVGLTLLGAVLSLLTVSMDSSSSKLIMGALFSSLFLGVGLLYELDSLKILNSRNLAARYVKNIARLELRERQN